MTCQHRAQALAASHGTPEESQQQEYAQTVILSINDDDEDTDVGLSIVMEELLTGCKAKDIGLKRAAVTLLHAFCAQTKADYSQYVPQLIRATIMLFTEEDQVYFIF